MNLSVIFEGLECFGEVLNIKESQSVQLKQKIVVVNTLDFSLFCLMLVTLPSPALESENSILEMKRVVKVHTYLKRVVDSVWRCYSVMTVSASCARLDCQFQFRFVRLVTPVFQPD